MAYTAEIKRIKKVLFAASNQTEGQDDNSSEGKRDQRSDSDKNQSLDSVIKRLVKYKDDNKKLKLILK